MSDTTPTSKTNNCGVKTQAGKDISKYNSLRHGVLRSTLLKHEIEESVQIQDCFMKEYNPTNLIERLLIETMVIAYVRLLRAVRAEQDYLSALYDPPEYERIEIFRAINPDLTDLTREGIYDYKLIKGHETLMKPEKMQELDQTYSRYIVTCERQFYRALHELQRIQSSRNGTRPTSMAVDVLSDKVE